MMTTNRQGEKRMTETIDYIKVETKSFQQMCKDICDLKERCRQLSEENLFLNKKLADQRLTTALGVPMSQADIEEEQFIAQGEAHYERFAFIGDDF